MVVTMEQAWRNYCAKYPEMVAADELPLDSYEPRPSLSKLTKPPKTTLVLCQKPSLEMPDGVYVDYSGDHVGIVLVKAGLVTESHRIKLLKHSSEYSAVKEAWKLYGFDVPVYCDCHIVAKKLGVIHVPRKHNVIAHQVARGTFFSEGELPSRGRR